MKEVPKMYHYQPSKTQLWLRSIGAGTSVAKKPFQIL